MRQPLVSLLLLATVALSSSNLLPTHTFETEFGLPRHNDNIFRNRFDARNIFYSLFCKQRIGAYHQDEVVQRCKYLQMGNHAENDNNDISVDEYNDGESKDQDENYNGEGFRKEQWHNYPRRLDRLQTYPYDRHKADHMKRSPEIMNYDNSDEVPSTNEDSLAGNNIKHVYDFLITSNNPHLTLKIRLPYLYKQVLNKNFTKPLLRDRLENGIDPRNMDYGEEFLAEDIPINLDAQHLEDKRNDPEDLRVTDDMEDISTRDAEHLPVGKRLFSLWSRLQSMSHEKGHELHHRRHLHAIYGHPDLDLGGDMLLTAETRAALMRPPGSPLRWG